MYTSILWEMAARACVMASFVNVNASRYLADRDQAPTEEGQHLRRRNSHATGKRKANQSRREGPHAVKNGMMPTRVSTASR
jgi:hypothetical protein